MDFRKTSNLITRLTSHILMYLIKFLACISSLVHLGRFTIILQSSHIFFMFTFLLFTILRRGQNSLLFMLPISFILFSMLQYILSLLFCSTFCVIGMDLRKWTVLLILRKIIVIKFRLKFSSILHFLRCFATFSDYIFKYKHSKIPVR